MVYQNEIKMYVYVSICVYNSNNENVITFFKKSKNKLIDNNNNKDIQ